MMTVQQAAQMMLDYGIPAHIRDRHVGNQNAPAGTSASMPVCDYLIKIVWKSFISRMMSPIGHWH